MHPSIEKLIGHRKCFFSAVNTGYATNGVPDDRCVDFYSARSGNGLYCAIVGNAALPECAGSNSVTAEISNQKIWRRVADCIREKGAIPGIQLSSAWPGYSGMREFVSPDTKKAIADYTEVAASIKQSDLDLLFQRLTSGTQMAVNAGFRHIQLNAAHGYLFSLLVDQRLFDLAGRVIQLISQWSSELLRSGIETSIRVSLRTGDAAFDERGRLDHWDAVASIPATYLDLSSGFYNVDKRLIYPSTPSQIALRLSDALEFARRFSAKEVIYSGRVCHMSCSEFSPNIHVGLCRDLIANPNFLATGRDGCCSSMKCHYHSRGVPYLECSQWANNLAGNALS